MKPIYLDCNATTPIDPKVREVLLMYLDIEFGNEGSRTHQYGATAKQAIQKARNQVSTVVAAKRDEVIFTSGATESNNLAILGLIDHANKTQKKHIITSAIEHKAVLEPINYLAEHEGFEVTIVPATEEGLISPNSIKEALRDDTILVSIMAANNETGTIQPLCEISEIIKNHKTYFHTDAAQLFGKNITLLKNQRIDFISISGHKIYAPKGIGALIARRRGFSKPKITPLQHGGGQERGIRPGTLPVFLIAALGEAAEQALLHYKERNSKCELIKTQILEQFAELNPKINTYLEKSLSNTLNLAIENIDSEAIILALKEDIAISNGSACTSTAYTPSHVLTAMGQSEKSANEAIRLSWQHDMPVINWSQITQKIQHLKISHK